MNVLSVDSISGSSDTPVRTTTALQTASVINDPKVRGNVKLNFVPFEDEQVRANPNQQSLMDRSTYLLDGKEFDDAGNESLYWVLERHPAEYPGDVSKPVSAEFVLDVWDWERASQGRGISPYATSTRNGPLRRSYRRATLDAAVTAAKLSFLLKTNVDRFSNGDNLFQYLDALEAIPLFDGEGMALPMGWEPSQLKAEHPTTSHEEFTRSNVAEMGRAAGQPGAVTLADAKGLNFACCPSICNNRFGPTAFNDNHHELRASAEESGR